MSLEPKRKEVFKNAGDMVKRQRIPPEGARGQIWDNLNIKVKRIRDYHLLKMVSTHESTETLTNLQWKAIKNVEGKTQLENHHSAAIVLK